MPIHASPVGPMSRGRRHQSSSIHPSGDREYGDGALATPKAEAWVWRPGPRGPLGEAPGSWAVGPEAKARTRGGGYALDSVPPPIGSAASRAVISAAWLLLS